MSMSTRPLRPSWALLIALFLACVGSALAKRKRSSKTSANNVVEKQQCEEGPCSDWDPDHRPLCLLRCQSDGCFDKVYAGNELEPGEVDAVRSREYTNCLTKERGERLRAERTATRSKRGR
ncbi:hypothetical protein T492DRAFT_953170, partial [Pavlovales sp. CCMP2436]